jgi:hypothetical protein
MPYEMHPDGEAYVVINTETKETKARHEPPDAKEKAERQIRLLTEIEKQDGEMGDG